MSHDSWTMRRPTAPPPISTGSWSLAPLMKNAPIRPPARRPTPKREMRKFYLHNNLWLPTVPWRPHRTSAPLVLFHFYILPCARSVARPDGPPYPPSGPRFAPLAPRGQIGFLSPPGRGCRPQCSDSDGSRPHRPTCSHTPPPLLCRAAATRLCWLRNNDAISLFRDIWALKYFVFEISPF